MIRVPTSPSLPSSPGSLSSTTSSTTTSSSSDLSPPPPSSVPVFASRAKSLPVIGFSPSAPNSPAAVTVAGPPSTRHPLAASPTAKRTRSSSAASPISFAPQPFFSPTLTDVPQAPYTTHNTLTTFDFPTTSQPVPERRSPPPSSANQQHTARPRRHSSKPYGGGGVGATGLSAGPGATTTSAGAGDATNQLEAKVVIPPLYYRGALAAILMYDITNADSFNDVKIWLDELRKNMSPDLIIHVVGAKVDLAPTQRAVDLNFARRSVAEWMLEGSPTAPSGRDPSPTSPTRLRTRTPLSTRIPLTNGPGGLPTSPSLPVTTASRPEPSAPSLVARVRKMSTKLTATAPSNLSAGGNSSSASSVSEAGSSGLGVGGVPSESMVRSGSMLGMGLGMSKSSSRGRKSHEEERREKEELERERIEELVRECGVEVSEVSGKDDLGIEDLFFDITRRLVERKAQIESNRILRSRDSIMIRDSDVPVVVSGGICC
ncbi:hypothetical protein P7C70_g4611, partial [Phenoliferia sp. Uapishka_3]